jgi:hypothetical protein
VSTENPVDYALRQFGISRAAFTAKYDFGKNHLLLVAQGRKESISTALLAALEAEAKAVGTTLSESLVDAYGFEGDIEDAYAEWIVLRRAEASLPRTVPPGNKEQSPWAILVDKVGSVSRMSAVLKVRYIHVRRYMTGRTMPKPIRESLTTMGYSGLDALDRRQQAWYEANQGG